MRPLVSIAGYTVPDPSEYNATTSTVVDSARNVEGKMVGAVIRDDIAKVEMTWKFISAQAWADLLGLFSIARGGAFVNPVEFFCQDTNSWQKKQMYVSDRTAGVYLRNPDGSIKGYVGARIALIEV